LETRSQPDPNRSIESLLTEFEVVRSAIIRLVEQGGRNKRTLRHSAEVCVARLTYILSRSNDGEIPACRLQPTRLRAEALEPELNAAILEIGKEDFLLENLDLQSLFSESLKPLLQ